MAIVPVFLLTGCGSAPKDKDVCQSIGQELAAYRETLSMEDCKIASAEQEDDTYRVVADVSAASTYAKYDITAYAGYYKDRKNWELESCDFQINSSELSISDDQNLEIIENADYGSYTNQDTIRQNLIDFCESGGTYTTINTEDGIGISYTVDGIESTVGSLTEEDNVTYTFVYDMDSDTFHYNGLDSFVVDISSFEGEHQAIDYNGSVITVNISSQTNTALDFTGDNGETIHLLRVQGELQWVGSEDPNLYCHTIL